MLRPLLVLAFGLSLCAQEQSSNRDGGGSTQTGQTSERISAGAVTFAIKSLFGADGSKLRIEVTSVCTCLVPPGRIEFSIADTAAPSVDQPSRILMWLGKLVTEAGKSYPIWARASVVETRSMVVASKDLKYKELLKADDISVEDVDVSPLLSGGPQRLEDYVGHWLNRPIARGTILTAASLVKPPDVGRGEQVVVDITTRGTHLSIQAEAETAGNAGESVALLNPMSHRRFNAIVSGPGTARVVIDPIQP